ncbi:MAG: hypothetical protein DMG38_03595 [Acidobacteria bacterium]|nr:MAG: hypothetical protein DMG38_03595 [Acidobacteriota bacterium]
MPSFLRAAAALLSATLLLVPPSFAFSTPLSDQAVREAYFLGQRRDESMTAFLNKYTKLLPRPKTGPHISAVTFLTPFALLVRYSSRQTDYSAQQAALDHKAHDEMVEIQIEILLTPSYGAILTPPTHSRSGSPTGIQFRSPEFWRAFKYHIFDGSEEITTDDITGEPQYQCSESGCLLNGAIVYIVFPATAFTSDSATIEVSPREGDPVSVDFDLSSLR